jgi:trk system potassium uptake protein TrkH
VILLPVNLGGFEVFSKKSNSLNPNRKLTLDERSMTWIKVSQKLIPVYLGLTATLWVFLTSLGTDGYTSLIRALSVISTSGISGPENFEVDRAGFFGELVIVIFLFFALSHNILRSFLTQFKLQNFLSNVNGQSFGNVFELIWGNFFTVVSFITTNGYVSSFWEFSSSSRDLPYTVIVLMGLCLFGGGVATTAGGIKLLRISILFSTFSNETGKLLHPSSVAGKNNPMKIQGTSVFMAWIFFMLFMVSVAALTIFLAMFKIRFEDALLLAVACLTTTGPIIEMAGPEKILISGLSVFSKMALVFGMILGRLEILVVLSLITFGFKRP